MEGVSGELQDDPGFCREMLEETKRILEIPVMIKIGYRPDLTEFVKQVERGVHKGRVLTPKGTSFLGKIAVQLSKSNKERQTAINVCVRFS